MLVSFALLHHLPPPFFLPSSCPISISSPLDSFFFPLFSFVLFPHPSFSLVSFPCLIFPRQCFSQTLLHPSCLPPIFIFSSLFCLFSVFYPSSFPPCSSLCFVVPPLSFLKNVFLLSIDKSVTFSSHSSSLLPFLPSLLIFSFNSSFSSSPPLSSPLFPVFFSSPPGLSLTLCLFSVCVFSDRVAIHGHGVRTA